MVQVAVLGSSTFVVGFRLAGIRHVVEVSQDPLKDMKTLTQNKEIGIVIVEESIMQSLDLDDRQDIESSVEPVFIPISVYAEQEGLKRLIKRSIGVDLWS